MLQTTEFWWGFGLGCGIKVIAIFAALEWVF
jgi:hypothetical protein